MRSGCSYNPKRNVMAGNSSNRKRPYGTMLLLALGAAVLFVVVFHKMKERRVFGMLMQDRDRQVLALQLLLEKEKRNFNEMKRKMADMKTKMSSLKSQRSELHNKLMEAEAKATYAGNIQREKEAELAEKQNEMNALRSAKEAESTKADLQVSTLKELLEQKQTEIEELKLRLVNQKQERSSTSQETRSETIIENIDQDKNEGMSGEENPQKGQRVKLITNVDMKDEKEYDQSQSSTDGSRDVERSGLEINQTNSTTEGNEEKKESENVELVSSEKLDTPRAQNEGDGNKENSSTSQNEISGNIENSQTFGNKEVAITNASEDETGSNILTDGNLEMVTNSTNSDMSKENVNNEETKQNGDKEMQEEANNNTAATEKISVTSEVFADTLQERNFKDSNGAQAVENHDDVEKDVNPEETDSENEASENKNVVNNVSDENNSKTPEDSGASADDAGSTSDEQAAKEETADQHGKM